MQKCIFSLKSRQSPKNPNFRPFWAQICQKIFFSKITLNYILHFANLHHCAKNQKKQMTKFREKSKKPKFWAVLGPNLPKKIFFSKIGLCHILGIVILHHCAKNQKKQMTKFWEKSKKPKFWSILGCFGPKFAQKKFFSKIGLRHILGIAILHLCAKNQKKLMSRSREKLVTNERTNEHRLIYRTSKVGPKRRQIDET